jgi:hypothetical protein
MLLAVFRLVRYHLMQAWIELHLPRGVKVSNDPMVEEKVAGIVGNR